MNYSLRQLKVFVTVARARSFSRAGEIIGLSQSAVSHSVKELEHQTGVRLLDRTTREVVLTEAGHQLAGKLERLLDELHVTLREAGRVGQQLTGTVRVAASQTISAHLIPQCIAHSNRRYPDIDFVLHDRPQQWVLESIRQGEVDFGIVIDPGTAADLQCESVLAEPFLLLCREDHRFSRQLSVNWQELQGTGRYRHLPRLRPARHRGQDYRRPLYPHPRHPYLRHLPWHPFWPLTRKE